MKVTLDKGAILPVRAHPYDAGLDLFTKEEFYLKGNSSLIVDTGVRIQIPHGFVGMLKSKSGLNVKYGIVSEGVIDSEYTGSIKVKLYNHSNETHYFAAGNKITQLVILPIALPELELVDSLVATTRGDNGFGSTGR